MSLLLIGCETNQNRDNATWTFDASTGDYIEWQSENDFANEMTNAAFVHLYNVEYGATGWQSTTPTNQVFYIKGSANSVAGAMDFIAYCWTDIQGYSKMGNYTGNGSTDGTFVYTGFKPAFVNFKRTTGAVANWQLWDNKRDIDNPVERAMHPDNNSLSSNDQKIDFLSNGFKIRSNQGHLNASGVNFIYQAFAESPLVGSNNVP